MANEFSHEPMDDASSQIRLLTISGGGRFGRRIRCNLICHSIVDAPDYIAVSYTWGNPKDLKTISVNGHTLRVRKNCWHVLRQAQHHGFTLPLWIDAICINQTDEREKSVQVSKMGDIYRSALQVNACLGPHQHRSEYLFGHMLEHARIVDLPDNYDIRYDRETPFTTNPGSGVYASILLERFGILTWFEAFGKHKIERLRQAYFSLMARPYFYRLWIFQEVYLGRKVMVLCGDSAMSLRDVHVFSQNFGRYAFLLSSGPRDARWHAPFRDNNPVGLITYLGLRRVTLLLNEVPTRLAYLDCYDARDRLYGLLQVLVWQGLAPISPDYSRSVWELALELLTGGYLDDAWPATSNKHMTVLRLALWMHWLHIGLDQHPVHEMLRRRRPKPAYTSPLSNNTSSTSRRRIPCIPHTVVRLSSYEASPPHLMILPDSSTRNEHRTNDIPPMLTPPCTFLVDSEFDVRAYLPSNAQPGDLLATFVVEPVMIGLILREVPNDHSQIHVVGQAILPNNLHIDAEGRPVPQAFGPAARRRPDVPLEVHFSPEDLMILVCQHVNFERGYLGDGTEPALLERLNTSVTDCTDPLSSYGVVVSMDEVFTED